MNNKTKDAIIVGILTGVITFVLGIAFISFNFLLGLCLGTITSSYIYHRYIK